ncbi:ABC transporter ATP-binding protein [Nocardioides sp. LHD-245]|uniref:ABC transporter ATP-binding protein n=1 Tax=Nocardioides sp. LHD-245 TaxID=3051387 RepID=UPI0027DFF9F1|nr:ABC transporter ATP-binding protein [Nocardioides sp. LHD-245]
MVGTSWPGLASDAGSNGPARLVVKKISLRFGGIVALDGPSFEIAPGEICGLIGPNGAGKTTLFNCVSGLYRPDAGSIMLGETDILALRPDQVAGAGIARTFQNLGLLPTQTVLDNVIAGASHRARTGMMAAALGLPSVAREERRERERARAVLDRLGLSGYESHLASGLPLGTLKRVELARALMLEPRLLMLDEPANGLIHEEVEELGALVRELRRELGFSVLLVEHHMGMVMSVCDHLVVLNLGVKIADGPPEQVRRDGAVVEAYLGGS